MTLQLDLSQCDPEDALARARDVLDGGGLVVVPTETVYGVAVREDRPRALARLTELKQGRTGPYSLAVASVDALADRLEPPSLVARRVARRWWPGPVTQILEARQGPALGVRVPGHPFTRELAGHAGPLLLPSANLPGEAAPVEVGQLSAAVLEAADLVVDGGRAALGEASSVIRPGVGGLSLLREGVVSRADLEQHALGEVLVVCSGNTCRSPMGAALLARALQDLAVSGERCLSPRVTSAGVFTSGGHPASEHAVAAMARRGLDLDGHRSRPAAAHLAGVDLVLGMTRDHVGAVREAVGSSGIAVELFDPEGESVPDPFGGTLQHYEATAATLELMAGRRAARLCPAPVSLTGPSS